MHSADVRGRLSAVMLGAHFHIVAVILVRSEVEGSAYFFAIELRANASDISAIPHFVVISV